MKPFMHEWFRYEPFTLNIKTLTTSQKSLRHDNINSMCLCLK